MPATSTITSAGTHTTPFYRVDSLLGVEADPYREAEVMMGVKQDRLEQQERIRGSARYTVIVQP